MITVVLHNGLNNRLLPFVSILRLALKTNHKVNVVWTYTPVRSCIAYHGELCKFNDLFKDIDNVSFDNPEHIDYQKNFEFRYWENKDHIIDVKGDDNVFVNYALYTIVSTEDNPNSIFVNLKRVIVEPRKFELDYIGEELSEIFKKYIKPIDELQNEIDHYHKLFKKNMIGIHIRKSDGGFSHYKWDDIIKKLLSQTKIWCSDKDNGVFLATDDRNVYVEFASKLGNNLLFYNPPEVLNNTKSTSGPYDKFNNDKFNVLCGVIELFLLSKCNKYIIGTADSTFSVSAMIIADRETQKYLINDVSNLPEFSF